MIGTVMLVALVASKIYVTMATEHTRMATGGETPSGRLPVACVCGFVPTPDKPLFVHLREKATVAKHARMLDQKRCACSDCPGARRCER